MLKENTPHNNEGKSYYNQNQQTKHVPVRVDKDSERDEYTLERLFTEAAQCPV